MFDPGAPKAFRRALRCTSTPAKMSMIPATRKIDANAVVPGDGSPHPVVWGTIVTQASYLANAARTNAARTAPKTLNAPPAATHGT